MQYLYSGVDANFFHSFCYKHLITICEKQADNALIILKSAQDKRHLEQHLLALGHLRLAPILTHSQFFSQFFTIASKDERFLGKELLKDCLTNKVLSPNVALIAETPALLNHCFEFLIQLIQHKQSEQQLLKQIPAYRKALYEELIDLKAEFVSLLKQKQCLQLINRPSIQSNLDLPYLKNKVCYILNSDSLSPWELSALHNFSGHIAELILFSTKEQHPELEYYFSDLQKIPEQHRPQKQEHHIHSYSSVEHEVEAQIERFIASGQQSAVFIAPNKKPYPEQLIHSLSKRGIDYASPNKAFQKQSVILKALCSILDCLKEELTLATLKELQVCELIDESYLPEAHRLDCYSIERLAKRFQIPWQQQPLLSLISSLQKQLDKAIVKEKDDIAKQSLTHSKDKLATLHKHYSYLRKQLVLCQNHSDLQDWHKQFFELLNCLGVRQTIMQLSALQQQEYKYYCNAITAFLSIYKRTGTQSFNRLISALKRYLIEQAATTHTTDAAITLLSIHDTAFLTDNELYLFGCLEGFHDETSKQNPFVLEPFSATLKGNLSSFKQNSTKLINNVKENNRCHFSVSEDNETPLAKWAKHFQKEKVTVVFEKSPISHSNIAQNQNISHPSLQASIHTFLSKHGCSATSLDMYQHCPYQFFLHYLLDFKQHQDEKQLLSQKDWGLFLHTVMAKFNQVLSEQTPNKNQYLPILKDLAEKELAICDEQNVAWAAKKTLLFGQNDQDGLLQIISTIYQNSDHLLQSIASEKRISMPINESNVQLKGSIDLLLNSPLGPIVLDYKSGKTLASATDTKELRALQIPIYFLLSRQLTNEQASASILFQIHSPAHCEEKVLACTKEAKESLFDLGKKRPFVYDASFFHKSSTHIHTLITAIQDGKLGTSPYPELAHMEKKRAKACLFCDYKLSCRYEKRFGT